MIMNIQNVMRRKATVCHEVSPQKIEHETAGRY